MSAGAETQRRSLERRAALLECLRLAGEDPVSGQEIARKLGISRAAVSNHMTALRDAGYEIESVTRRGHRLLSSPDLPLPIEVVPRLRHTAVQVYGGMTTGSTNDDAKAYAQEGAPEPLVVLASQQTKGKGRLGRTWQSPAGGLYASYLLRPEALPAEMSSLSLVVALAVADGLEQAGVSGVRLKWPNDVLLFDDFGAECGKAAGILLEMAAQIERVEYVVAGIGLNVNRPESAAPLDDGGRHAAAYVSDMVENTPSLAELAALQIDAICTRYEAWRAARFSFAPFKAEYERRLCIMGEQVTVSRADGVHVAEGVVAGVDDAGCLLVCDAQGLCIPVAAGEVTLRG